MKLSKTLTLTALLTCSLGLPRISYAISGCTNANLSGTYNAQIQNANLSAVLNPAPAGAAGANASSVNGFANSNVSLTGNLPGMGRYLFDGSGTIVGLATTTSSTGATVASGGNAAVGTYSVNADCTASLSLATGQKFDAVIVSNGNEVLLAETDTAGLGGYGMLERSPNSCVSFNVPQSYGFSFFGVTAATGATGTTAPAAGMPYVVVGTVQLDGVSNFTIKETVDTNGSSQRISGTGSYSVAANCVLKLTFTGLTNSTGAAVAPPASFNILLNNTNLFFPGQPNLGSTAGILSVQPTPGTTFVGNLVSQ